MENIAIYAIIIKRKRQKLNKKGKIMKSTHHRLITKEEAQKLPSINTSNEPMKSYTKADFMTPGKVAEKFNITTEEASNLMKKLKRHNSSFMLNGRLAMLVVDLGKHGALYLHPMGTSVFQQHLSKQRG